MELKKPHIIDLKTSSRYAISGGFINIDWEVKDELFCVLKTGRKFTFFKTKKKSSVLVYNSQKIDLIAFSFGGIVWKSCFIKLRATKRIILRRTLETALLEINKSKLNKPSNTTYKPNNNLSINTKNIKFNINPNTLDFKK